MIRPLDARDAAACSALAQSRGWPTEPSTWTPLLALGQGFGIDASDGELAGAVILTRFGATFATLAMMLVGPAHARRGLGARLVAHAVAHAPGAVVSLFASPMGYPLYARLGFVENGATARFEGSATLLPRPSPARVEDVPRPLRESDFAKVVALDEDAQGAPRAELLAWMRATSECALVIERHGRVVGFALARRLQGFLQVAPIVSIEEDDACALAAALAEDARDPLRIDLGVGERALEAWCSRAGLRAVTRSPSMSSGGPLPGRRAWIRALATRAYG